MKAIDLTGRRFGRLIVLRSTRRDGRGLRIWLCACDCGGLKEISKKNLDRGTRSCGCLTKERMSSLTKTHGLSMDETGKETRLHRIWANMLARCYTDTHFAYKNYGGRGITICDEWKEDYLPFHTWATSHGYSENLTIERKNVNGDYRPENCTWITKGDNSRNQRTTKITIHEAKRIKQFLWAGIPTKDLALLFGVSLNHIRNIKSGHRWNLKGR